MMLKVFRTELEGLRQLDDDEQITDPYRSFRSNVTQYLQDIYRFFKLSPYRKEFEDVFTGRLDIYNSEFFRLTCNAAESEAGLADYFFSKDFYEDALLLFDRMLTTRPDDPQLYEKIAYCHQQSGNYEEALRYYRMSDLIVRKAWTIKKIGLCCRKLGRNGEALDSYLQALNIEPGNVHTSMMIAHCYLDLREYEEALNYYFRVEYHEPGNLNILRPIAYCYFALGRFEESSKYYERLSAGKLTGHDYINLGHLSLCRGERKEAVKHYRESILIGKLTIDELISVINEDQPLLVQLGAKADDLPILLDYLLFNIS
jgi:tetratricopeptide (TPR) repeat protein